MELEEALKKITDLETALTTANGEAANRRKTAGELRDQLATFEGIDPVKVKELQDKAASLEQDRLKQEGKFEEALGEALKGKDAEIETLKGMVQSKDGMLSNLTIDTAFLSAIDGQAINNEQVLSLVRANIKMEDGKPVVYDGEAPKLNTKGERMSVADYGLDFLAKNPHMAKPGAPGSGSQGNNDQSNQGGNVITRAEFAALDPAAQAKHCETGTIAD